MIQCRLIGKDIAKSMSPLFHNQLSKYLDIDLEYQLKELDNSTFTQFLGLSYQLQHQGISCANVTYPYKELAYSIADEVDSSAAKVCAANTLLFKHGKIHAFNTDYSGFIKAYRANREALPGKVVIVGCGGVGKAIATALQELQAASISLYDKDLKKMQTLSAALGTRFGKVEMLTERALSDAIASADGVVNCTPLGHYAHPGSAVPLNLIETQSWVFDAVYTPINTPFICQAQKKNMTVITGDQLFIHQAIDAFELFTQKKVPKNQFETFRKSRLEPLLDVQY